MLSFIPYISISLPKLAVSFQDNFEVNLDAPVEAKNKNKTKKQNKTQEILRGAENIFFFSSTNITTWTVPTEKKHQS